MKLDPGYVVVNARPLANVRMPSDFGLLGIHPAVKVGKSDKMLTLSIVVYMPKHALNGPGATPSWLVPLERKTGSDVDSEHPSAPCVVPVGPSRRLSNFPVCRRFAKEVFEHLILGAMAILQQSSPGERSPAGCPRRRLSWW